MSRASALVAKLRKDPKVRDAEALAAWIGRRKGGLASARKRAAMGGTKSGGDSGPNFGAKKRSITSGGPKVDPGDPFGEDFGPNEEETPEEKRQRKMEERILREMEKADRAKLYSAIRDQGGIKPSTPKLQEEYRVVPDAYGGGSKGLPGDVMAEYLATHYPELGIETEQDMLDYFAEKFGKGGRG